MNIQLIWAFSAFRRCSQAANFVGPVTATGAGWTCTVSGSGPYLISCSYFGPPVPAGGLMQPLTITAIAKGTGGYVNCASINVKAGQDVRPRDNRGCVGGEIKPGEKGYDVGIRKTGPGPLMVGQTGTFTLNMINTGPSPVNAASGVAVTDILPWDCQGFRAGGGILGTRVIADACTQDDWNTVGAA